MPSTRDITHKQTLIFPRYSPRPERGRVDQIYENLPHQFKPLILINQSKIQIMQLVILLPPSDILKDFCILHSFL